MPRSNLSAAFACLLLAAFACHAAEPAAVSAAAPAVAASGASEAAPDPALTLAEAARLSLINQPYLRQHEGMLFADTETRFLDVDTPDVAPFKDALEVMRNGHGMPDRDIINLGDSFLTPAQRADARLRRVRMVHADADADVMRREVARDTSLAWLSLYQAEHAMLLEQVLQREYKSGVAAAEIAYRGGKGSQADIWKAEDALAAARDRELEWKGRAAVASAELQRWIGEQPITLAEKFELADAPPLDQLLLRVPSLPHLGRYWAAQSEANDEIKLVEKEMKAASPAVQSDNRVAVRQHMLAAMRAMRDGIQQQVTANLRQLRADLKKSYAEWDTAKERRDLFDQTVLKNAAHRLQSTLAAYANGKADFAAVLEARCNEIEARMKQLYLQTGVAMARVQLQVYE